MLRFRPVRILLDYRPALRERTGVGEYVHELTRALARTAVGDEITILSASWKDRPSPELAADLADVHIADRRIPVRGLTWAWNHLEWPPVEWLAGDTDVVHAQTPLMIPAIRAAQVVTIHDLDFLLHPERAAAEMRRDYPRLVGNHATRADHIIVSSHYAAREVILRLDLPTDKVSVCSPGAPDWAHEIGTEHTSDSGKSILFVGTLEPRKNIGRLLDAYSILRERRADAPPLVLAGRVRPEMEAEMQRLESPPLAGHVTRLGYVSHEARQQLYREARLLVLPSLEEGFGLPVLEAMACGVPVVISTRGSLPEVAGDAARPVDPLDANAIAGEMERLLHPEPRRDAVLRGRAQAARYSWDACAAAARTAYREAVAARARRSP
jgi:glycosyltransferase involved in cell wall biosynthesis